MAPLLFYGTLVLLWVSPDITLSQTIVETLPGFPGKLPFKLETGYIGVGDSEDAQIFYYFFESERNPQHDPLMLFLTGGPGCSGLSTILFEMGPFTFDKIISNGSIPTLKLRPYSWTKVSNLLVIDQPVGTGYSYGKTVEPYITNDTQSAELTYQFLKKWLMVHPEYLKNPLYIGGDSYAGIIVPLVVQNIYNGNEVQGDKPLNIKGYVLGNPFTDKFADINKRVKYSHRVGLLSDSLYESAKSNCKENYINVDPNNQLCWNDLQRISECIDNVCYSHILRPNCNPWSMGNKLSTLLLPSSDQTDAPIVLPQVKPWTEDDEDNYSYIWANDKNVQDALHIRKGTILEWLRCNTTTYYNGGERAGTYYFNVQSVVSTHQNLTFQNTRALIYSGDHDMIVPHTSTEEWIGSLRLTAKIDWRPWFVEGEVAGYTVKYLHLDYELTYATVKGAGHIALEYKPKECFAMIEKWLVGDLL